MTCPAPGFHVDPRQLQAKVARAAQLVVVEQPPQCASDDVSCLRRPCNTIRYTGIITGCNPPQSAIRLFSSIRRLDCGSAHPTARNDSKLGPRSSPRVCLVLCWGVWGGGVGDGKFYIFRNLAIRNPQTLFRRDLLPQRPSSAIPKYRGKQQY